MPTASTSTNVAMKPEPDADDGSELSSLLGSTESSNRTSRSSHTSVEPAEPTRSTRSPSPAPSVYSVTSSIYAQAFTTEHGRRVNTYSEVYRLPADEEEMTRLDKLYELYRDVLGDYSPAFRQALADDENAPDKACLDLGCGSGIWITQAAQHKPNVTFVAVDLIPLTTHAIPSNCRAEVDNINLGLEHFYGQFDFVHVRNVVAGVTDYYKLLGHVARVLRPFGAYEGTEMEWRVYDRERRPIVPDVSGLWPSARPQPPTSPSSSTAATFASTSTSSSPSRPRPTPASTSTSASSQPNPTPAPTAPHPPHPPNPTNTNTPYLAQYMTAMSTAARMRGAHIDAPSLLARWVSQHQSFEDVVVRDIWLPVSAWMGMGDGVHGGGGNGGNNARPGPGEASGSGSHGAGPSASTGSRGSGSGADAHVIRCEPGLERARKVGNMVADDTISLIHAGRVLLLLSGIPEPTVSFLEEHAIREVREARLPLFFRVVNVTGRKKLLGRR
ncbi:hypothetical protein BD410DRAFT_783490 [Rickenella mellea]|uniref:S-adenosyl-L-methionine-dependent methyltransferase n=1 Tax=Rickenella mellea TaxID=50990 RepID=A0A4Y7QHX8_9AGAM|nr:hypothetical protein BD410DRAFT_783490 [Rickenella mellea]